MNINLLLLTEMLLSKEILNSELFMGFLLESSRDRIEMWAKLIYFCYLIYLLKNIFLL